MKFLLKLSGLVDALNKRVGQAIMWLILAAILVSGGNAVMRKTFSISSNAFLETQWYLFSAVFLLGAGYTFLKNAHVRIDFVSSRLSARARSWIDVFGILLILAPFCWIVIRLSWPLFFKAWQSGEISMNYGGLIRWPVYLLVPLGMALLLQGHHGGPFQGIHGPVQGPVREEPQLEEGVRGLRQVPRRREHVVPLRRSQLRQLHAGAEAVSAVPHRPNPARLAPAGFGNS